MALVENLPQTALAGIILYLSWVVLRPLLSPSCLDNLPGPPSKSWFSGNLKQFMSRHCWAYREELARKYPRVSVMHGLFGSRWVHVWDPKAFHAIFIKEQDIYEEPVQAMRVLLGPGLLGTLGEQHRRQRKMLNPVFSTKHLRDMTPIFYSVVHKTRDAILERVRAGAKDGVELDMLSWMGRTTLEVLGQAGLGYSFDPLTEDRPDDFANAVKDLFPQLVKTIVPRMILPYVAEVGPAWFRRAVVEAIPNKSIQRLKDISDIMHQRSVLIYNEKKAALEKGDDALKHQIGEGRDIMSILLRANVMAAEEDKLPDDELIGQVSTMVLAGMDTTANSLARVLQLLAEHPDVQEKLRDEVVNVAETEGTDGTIEFDRLMDMPYMDAVCRETLRISPGVTSLFRDTTQDVVMPVTEPIRMRDGTHTNAVPIPKGTRIIANVTACNRDPALWGPDANDWRPSRWLEPLPREVEEAHIPGVYSHLMTFIGGSRACIGFKLAQVEIKTVLFVLLQQFRFETTGKPISWNFAAVQYPSVGPEGEPEMPLKVVVLRP
ncbi:cytochrome P450 [Lentinus tigrinus ALCF2SS1-7]|uniref:Cytochrome P450 n=1 Tax=Lentinus tigrinus ALCF2SS1-6 TaxID=1328759 RepID=A0A5C2SNL0_9APHY|nr:cytochrome P450 [Lentinus tigrinus ALCF2SS1-6]RPD79155.1 cytochrome P450 [Lentinus tigrinus ALCF2SS1-7]